jgi:putative MATE family efflux protein
VILNFALDPIFIFGWWGLPVMGVMGAALATLGSQSIAALIGMAVLLRGKYGIHLLWKDFVPDLAFIRRAFFLGLPASVEMSARGLGLTVLTFLITSFGTLAIASYGVASNVLQVAMIPAMGLSMAVSTLAGQNIGARQTDRAARIGNLGAWLGFWMLEGFGVVTFLFAAHLVAFFVPSDQGVIDHGAKLLRIISLAWGFMGAQFALNGVLRASGAMVMTMVLTLVSQWVVMFPLAWVLAEPAHLGASGIWWAFPITNLVTLLLTLGVYAKGDWKRRRLTEPEQVLEEKVAEEILSEEGFAQRTP